MPVAADLHNADLRAASGWLSNKVPRGSRYRRERGNQLNNSVTDPLKYLDETDPPEYTAHLRLP